MLQRLTHLSIAVVAAFLLFAAPTSADLKGRGASNLTLSKPGLGKSPSRRTGPSRLQGSRDVLSRGRNGRMGRTLRLSRYGVDRSPGNIGTPRGITLRDSNVGLDTPTRRGTEDGAWGLLAETRDQEALRAFARLARFAPSEGEPRIGMALAAAQLAYDGTAVAMMRRAARTDSDALLYLALPAAVRPDVRALTPIYAGMNTADGYFMEAALWTLLDDAAAARAAIADAKALGDRKFSTGALEAAVDLLGR